ncbi:selenoprotein S [Brachionichthys hirsutus]|uniref:selenoprotein S n=1 Tax=Brachionichthys hirsutus TaxID=412623 RepID=UPI003604601A
MDDDVEIADVSSDDFPDVVKNAPVRNQDLSSLSAIVQDVLSQYGWILLAVTLLVYLLIQHIKGRSSQRDSGSAPGAQPDTEHVARKHEAMEAVRRKMQEELDAKAAVFKEKQKQVEEERRKQKIEMWDNLQQGKSFKGPGTPSQAADEASSSTAGLKAKTDKKPLRSADYNPLTGQGGGTCSWRPGRRGPSSGG